MEIVNLVLDIALIFMAAWMVNIVTGYGGSIGRAFNTVAWGSIILGVAHLVETITFRAFHFSQDFVEFSHRVIIFAGFALLIVGFQMFIRSR